MKNNFNKIEFQKVNKFKRKHKGYRALFSDSAVSRPVLLLQARGG